MDSAEIEKSHGNVCGNVLEKLRRDIILKRYVPGSRLLEATLATELKVSRGSVRVALQDLIKEGMIDESPEGHKIVPAITKSTIEDMYELREWLELKAVGTILSSGSIRYSPLMGVLAEIEHGDPSRTVEDYYKLDLMFHRVVLRMSGNRAILQAWETLSPVIYTLLSINASSDYRESYTREFAEKHKSILDLIILRDRACIDLMRRHIDDAKAVTLGVLAEIDSGALI
jgi:DNA-binding GntR family transcriptional regulator